MIATLVGASVPNAFLVNSKMRSRAFLRVRTLSTASTPPWHTVIRGFISKREANDRGAGVRGVPKGGASLAKTVRGQAPPGLPFSHLGYGVVPWTATFQGRPMKTKVKYSIPSGLVASPMPRWV